MSRKSKIRWRKEDKQAITNAVRIFNSKITRTLKKNPKLADYLPARVSTKDLYDRIGTRQDFKRELNSVSRFMKKGAEKPVMGSKGIKTTDWEKKEIGLKVAQINRKRTAERKKADVSTYKGTMGAIQNANLKPKKFDINKIKESDWEKYVQAVEKQVKDNYYNEKAELYKQNYLKAIINVFGLEGSNIYGRLLKVPAEELIRMFYDDPVLQIDFVYDPNDMYFLMEAIQEHLKEEGY